ncbi:hypothetical protein Ait01nite_047960 [Actinoplanes italicus]|uniref:Uncharacterized protein n=1 Tax=Actinoplanes italicus TaxID=113567 RepID=A0A2T0K9T4_9ACTN|nr:hypothetical protein [Actinoplanes italicus]PRX19898.1 hypothetical protein CLV67_109163 [Actinoplanes italicus]GIE31751.1 hypothetical protein Ait01nite_047960 [Actinoplanes italicus]
MKAQRFGVALLLAVSGLVPVAAAPAGAAPGDGRQFRQGYKDGFDSGLEAARTDCAKPVRAQTFEITDYVRGYILGFGRGFDAGRLDYCEAGDEAEPPG